MGQRIVVPWLLQASGSLKSGQTMRSEEWSDHQLWLDERQRRVQNAVGERRSVQERRRVESVQISGQLRHDPAADLLRHRLLSWRARCAQTHTQRTHPTVAQCPPRVQRGLCHAVKT